MDIHPAADGYDPMAEDSEFSGLKEDIAKYGLRESIILYGGQILDGRHRYRACKELGIEPDYITLDAHDIGHDPEAYVDSMNLHRRHLTIGQRAIKVAQALRRDKEKRKEPADENVQICTKRTEAEAAKAAGISRRSVSTAVKLLDEAPPEVVADVKAGKTTLNAAVKKISGGVTFNTDELEDAPAGLAEVQADLREYEKRLRELARFGREVLGATGNEITRPWCARYSVLTLIQPLQHVARTILNDLPIGGTPTDPKLSREEKAEQA